jgi:hypothetical protein
VLECDSNYADCPYAYTWTSSEAMSNNGRLYRTNVSQVASAVVSGVPFSKVSFSPLSHYLSPTKSASLYRARCLFGFVIVDKRDDAISIGMSNMLTDTDSNSTSIRNVVNAARCRYIRSLRNRPCLFSSINSVAQLGGPWGNLSKRP